MATIVGVRSIAEDGPVEVLLAAGVPSLSIKNLWELAHIDAVGWEAHRFDVGPREADDRASSLRGVG